MSGLLLLTLAILAQSLSLPPQLDLISHPSDNVAFPNGSSSSSTVQNLTAGPSYYCDMRYGSLTTPEPCNDAFRKIPIYAYDQKFVFRRYEHGPDDKLLPVRFLSDDGLCAIDIEIKPASLGDIAGGDTIAYFAQFLVEKCVDARRKGGNVNSIGAKGDISITVRSYAPQVECDASAAQAPPSAMCEQALGHTPVNARNRLFAKFRDPSIAGVTLLPRRFYQGPCQVRVDTSSDSLKTSTSWLDIWRAGVAVNTMCVQNGKAGTASGIGNNSQISIRLSTITPVSR